MTAPTKLFVVDVDSTDPGDNLIHMACSPCIDVERRPLLAWCGRDVTHDVMVDPLDYGPDDCSLCSYAHATSHCPMCGRKALP